MFTKTVNHNNRQEMINFLENHFRYYTMGSWNRCTSYANNVKIYNLNLPQEVRDKAWDFISAECEDFWFNVHDFIADFEAETGYTAGFNGQSGGYIVLYDTVVNGKGNRRAAKHDIDQYENFDEWETDELIERVKLVQAFDRLCDAIREEFIYFVTNAEIKDVEVVIKSTKRVAALPE